MRIELRSSATKLTRNLDIFVAGAIKRFPRYTNPFNGLTHICQKSFPILSDWFSSSLRPSSARRRMRSNFTFRSFSSAGALIICCFQLVDADGRGQALIYGRRPEIGCEWQVGL